MSEEISASKARKTRVTAKVAEEAAVVKNINLVEHDDAPVNDDGQKVIAGAKKTRSPRTSNVQSKEDNTVGSRAADSALNRKVDTTKPEPEVNEKVALWSDKNIRWSEVGTLVKGYNIVTKEAAVKWLDRAGIRKATPEEVATHYGK
jgi:hypothetical protein